MSDGILASMKPGTFALETDYHARDELLTSSILKTSIDLPTSSKALAHSPLPKHGTGKRRSAARLDNNMNLNNQLRAGWLARTARL